MPEDLNLKCKNCSHTKRKHLSFSRIPERGEIQPKKCKECGCEDFDSKYTKEYADEVFEEFLELHSKTRLHTQDVGPGGKYESQNINVDEMKKLMKLEKELKKCLDFLDDNQLIKLVSQNGLNTDIKTLVHKILTDRKLDS